VCACVCFCICMCEICNRSIFWRNTISKTHKVMFVCECVFSRILFSYPSYYARMMRTITWDKRKPLFHLFLLSFDYKSVQFQKVLTILKGRYMGLHKTGEYLSQSDLHYYFYSSSHLLSFTRVLLWHLSQIFLASLCVCVVWTWSLSYADFYITLHILRHAH